MRDLETELVQQTKSQQRTLESAEQARSDLMVQLESADQARSDLMVKLKAAQRTSQEYENKLAQVSAARDAALLDLDFLHGKRVSFMTDSFLQELKARITASLASVDAEFTRRRTLVLEESIKQRYAAEVAEAKRAAQAAAAESKLCVVCMASERNCCFAPCGHINSCMDCALQLNKCPVCRLAVQQRVKAFM